MITCICSSPWYSELYDDVQPWTVCKHIIFYQECVLLILQSNVQEWLMHDSCIQNDLIPGMS